ncbi:MAG: polysaccharide biosynthesis/export family protein [Alphaproteobacteria bacterium]
MSLLSKHLWRGLASGALLVALALSGCSGSGLPTTEAPMKVSAPGQGYRLEPGNQIRLTVFNETTLSGDFVVDPSGNVSLPLVGNVPAAGVTASTLSERIATKLVQGSLLRDPQVSVEILTFRPFYVLGEVRQPGEFPYTPGVTVLSAIARAGGYDYRARENKVLLVRQEGGEQVSYFATEQMPLLPGDIVKVLERLF